MARSPRIVVVVDDDPPVRLALRRLLSTAGFDVEIFASGEEFLQVFGTRHIDCVILDLHMQKVDGFAVLERLAACGRHLPVVVLTGHDSPEVQQRVASTGTVEYITKPVQRQVILDAIERAIAGPESYAHG